MAGSGSGAAHTVCPGVLSLPPVSANEFIFMCAFGHDQQLYDGGMCVCACVCDGGTCACDGGMCVRACVHVWCSPIHLVTLGQGLPETDC